MGIYVNPKKTAFKDAVNSVIYVDKSTGRLPEKWHRHNTKEKRTTTAM